MSIFQNQNRLVKDKYREVDIIPSESNNTNNSALVKSYNDSKLGESQAMSDLNRIVNDPSMEIPSMPNNFIRTNTNQFNLKNNKPSQSRYK